MNNLITHLFHQGVLDEQFIQLQQLQDEESPTFVSEVTSVYFRETEKLLQNIRALLWADRECRDYKKMGIHINQLKGSSSTLGARRLASVCIAFRTASEHCNWARCVQSLKLLEHEYCYLKNKLHEILQIEQQRLIATRAGYH